MLLITENLQVQAYTIIEKYSLEDMLNRKKYTVSDTPLTYRQVNSLDTDKLLNDKRKDKQEWRKFSLKELIYIGIVVELKKFGFKHEQLKQLWFSFFKKYDKSLEPNLEPNEGESLYAIACVFGGVEMSLCFDNDGNIQYIDPVNSVLFTQNSKPLIKICLNEIVNKLVKIITKEEIPIVSSIRRLVLDHKVTTNSKKEDELLNIIRNKFYSSIRVKKKNGEIATVYAEKYNSEGEMGLQELETLINAKDYQDILLTKRDGKIVNYKIEETFKL